MNTQKIKKAAIKTLDNKFYSCMRNEENIAVSGFIDWCAWEEIEEQVDKYVSKDFANNPNREEIFNDLMNEIIVEWKEQIHKKIELAIKNQ